MTSIVFMGTPQFAVPVLEGLLKQAYDVKAVVTQPDRPVGRKHRLTASPVKEVAVKNNIEVLQPEKISGSEEMKRVIDLAPDLIVTAAYGQFLPSKLLNSAKIAAINVHGSLLPKYRGGAPVQYSLVNGDDKTGVTLIYMIKKMDAGEMLGQAELPITMSDDTGSLFEKLSFLGRDLLLAKLPALIAGNLNSTPQNEDEVVFAPTIKPEEEQLLLSLTAEQIDWKVRALRPAPGAFFENFAGKRTKLWNVDPLEKRTEQAAGTIIEVTKHQLTVAAAKGTVYQINELQPAGKQRLTVTDYLNGLNQKLEKGQVLISDDK
ncbi:methionyl-tRNA formyltransferase [Ligilactobacillus acidipiscis DSM 15836]|uniref:Methionyl-tRNA formyltransferase n=2 Tax=Ligilactobacillus acidipiscis TaxID=89059 RepID=A0A0R2KB87_9LACO|nr:methionyl-tRNA formyltransferase [Ligilactobacillus acidipiscis]KRM32213.1 methionyl-tRNA formyltransferase [Ligilactobacillus acidipiscis DSM 15836]KRN83735.1 methionyl-tRNA formyltransferase [Ligilactobacillus acidipiscis]SFV40443.1 Methionyl-tRNA formyltransferase [Ligilactobacillus acidipiscis]GAW64621.1 methionyl-tRNA formyltransferase [Ligilactobacillus acidipiscis]GEN19447.1 methionyl-tRNA formyltransferase [Ligilactobacillus acidipiscis]